MHRAKLSRGKKTLAKEMDVGEIRVATHRTIPAPPGQWPALQGGLHCF
jgi:hypothetical protein